MAVALGLSNEHALAELVAAGETPSPELVAAAGQAQGRVSARAVWAMAAVVLLALLLSPALSARSRLPQIVPFQKAPEALEDRARELLVKLGYESEPVSRSAQFGVDVEYLWYLKDHDTSPTRWDVLALGQPSVISYCYRESPRPLVAWSFGGRVSLTDPPLTVSDMRNVYLDMRGRLSELYVVPQQVDDGGPSPAPRWDLLFEAAGFDMKQFKPIAPQWIPPFHADARAAWEGTYPGRPDVPARVEAAAWRGKPV